jgi:acylphosphatase
MMMAVKLLIKGKVQGVSYRASARKKALELGLKGYVMNLQDGDVEAVATGPKQAVDEFISWCMHGPVGAEVDSVIKKPHSGEGFSGFTIRR